MTERDFLVNNMVDQVDGLERRLGRLERHGLTGVDGLSDTTQMRETKIDAVNVIKGAAAPTVTTRAVGASGGVAVPVLSFSKTTQQDCYFEIHTAEELNEAIACEFHLMWVPGASWSSGNYMWKLEYLVLDEDGASGAGTPTTISMNVTPGDATTLIETEFTSTIALEPDQTLACHFYRDVANDNGNDTGEVRFFELWWVSR